MATWRMAACLTARGIRRGPGRAFPTAAGPPAVSAGLRSGTRRGRGVFFRRRQRRGAARLRGSLQFQAAARALAAAARDRAGLRGPQPPGRRPPRRRRGRVARLSRSARSLLPVEQSRSPAFRIWRRTMRLPPESRPSRPADLRNLADAGRRASGNPPRPRIPARRTPSPTTASRFSGSTGAAGNCSSPATPGMSTESELLDAKQDVSADVIIAGRHRTRSHAQRSVSRCREPAGDRRLALGFPVAEKLDPESVDYWRSRGIQVIHQGETGGVTVRVDESGKSAPGGFRGPVGRSSSSPVERLAAAQPEHRFSLALPLLLEIRLRIEKRILRPFQPLEFPELRHLRLRPLEIFLVVGHEQELAARHQRPPHGFRTPPASVRRRLCRSFGHGSGHSRCSRETDPPPAAATRPRSGCPAAAPARCPGPAA